MKPKNLGICSLWIYPYFQMMKRFSLHIAVLAFAFILFSGTTNPANSKGMDKAYLDEPIISLPNAFLQSVIIGDKDFNFRLNSTHRSQPLHQSIDPLVPYSGISTNKVGADFSQNLSLKNPATFARIQQVPDKPDFQKPGLLPMVGGIAIGAP